MGIFLGRNLQTTSTPVPDKNNSSCKNKTQTTKKQQLNTLQPRSHNKTECISASHSPKNKYTKHTAQAAPKQH